MSWQGYVDNLVGNKAAVSKAAFIGLDGSIWAKSTDLNLSGDEAKKLVDTFSNPSLGFQNGFMIEGKKHMCIRASPEDVVGKLGTSGFSAYKTNQCVILGYYVEPATPGNCEVAVGKYADYLKGSGY